MVTFTAGSGPGDMSTPSCDITIINDNMVEEDETFSLSAIITNNNGQAAQFTAGGDSATATIIEDRMWFIHPRIITIVPVTVYVQARSIF